MNAFDGSSPQDQETAPDQQGDMHDPDAFIEDITRSTFFHECYNPAL